MHNHLFDCIQLEHSMGESGLGCGYSFVEFRDKRTRELHFRLCEQFISIENIIWSDDGCRCAFTAEYDTDDMMCSMDGGNHYPTAVVVDVLNGKLLKIYDFDNNSTLKWADNQLELKGLGDGFDNVDDFLPINPVKKDTPKPFHERLHEETYGFEFVNGPKLVGKSNTGKGFLNVDINGQVIVTFPGGTVMEVNPYCRMYDAPHLVCWLPDDSEVGFFASFNGQNCMCIVRRYNEKADMWYIHHTPSEVIYEPAPIGGFRITPIVNGEHIFKAPFYYDDFEMVPNKIIKICAEDLHYETKRKTKVPEIKAPETKASETIEKTKVSDIKPKKRNNLFLTLALIFSRFPRESKKQSNSNLLIIIILVLMSSAWIYFSVVCLKRGDIETGATVLSVGGLGVFIAIIGRIVKYYEPRTSRRSIGWRFFVLFVASFSTLTYQIAKGINALIVAIAGCQPEFSTIFTFEGIITGASFVTFMVLCICTKSDKKALLYAWLRMVSFALLIGFSIFVAENDKQPSRCEDRIENTEPAKEDYLKEYEKMIMDSVIKKAFSSSPESYPKYQ